MVRKQTMKVYHGIPKSVTDKYTVFYASFDGTIKPEIGNQVRCNYNSFKFAPSLTGSGLKSDVYSYMHMYRSFFDLKNSNQFTVDAIVDSSYISTFSATEHYGVYLQNGDTPRIRFLSWQDDKNTLAVRFYNASGGSIDTIKIKLTSTVNHIRLTYNNGVIKIYVNGREALNYTRLGDCLIDTIRMHQLQAIISDLHISNIDRGSYVVNLPQDFIDGKATVRPRMGQQHIKGDPMYSQITVLKVPNLANVQMSETYREANYRRYVKYPELKTTGSDTWALSSTVTIKGLNGEVISGVVDADTALCKVVSYTVNTNKIIVDDTSKLSAGDTIQFVTSQLTAINSARTISAINGKEVTLNATLTVAGAEYIIETTALSSSPVVLTQDGAVVNGTWSGLGTNEAVFTLGTNSNVSGKDLYIEYSLTTMHGNSDFPELPHTIEKVWGENGVEMKPVNNVVITDDFLGKVKGSVKECPHTVKYRLFNSLSAPTDIVEELAAHAISVADSVVMSTTETRENCFPQQLFSFDLIEMVERKFGCKIPGRNKAQWLKDNCDSVRVNYKGYGTNPTGNKVKITIFDHSSAKWLNDWVTITTSAPSHKNGAFRGEHFDRMIPNGILHVLAYTDPSNGVSSSTVYTDYISVEMTLKANTAFTTFYCDNNRAREDKCNPILIQKETKTIKRYLPSKECFTTESLYVNPTTFNVTAEVLSGYLTKEETYLTTLGSGAYLIHNNIRFKNCINKLGLGIQAYQYANKPLGNTTVGAYTDLYTIRTLSQPYPTDNLMYPPQSIPNIPCVLMTPYLLNAGSELSLGLLVLELNASGARTAAYTKAYTLPNRPLIK